MERAALAAAFAFASHCDYRKTAGEMLNRLSEAANMVGR
jgi:hypothetical protein